MLASLLITAIIQVTKLTWVDSTKIPLVASGIEFADASGTRYTAMASKEVILAAGAIMVYPAVSLLF